MPSEINGDRRAKNSAAPTARQRTNAPVTTPRETPAPFLNLATYYERVEKNPAKALAALAEADRRAPGWRPARERAARLKMESSP